MDFCDSSFTSWLLDFVAGIYYLLNDSKAKDFQINLCITSALRDRCPDTSHRGICAQGNSKWMLIFQHSWILNLFVNDGTNQVLQGIIWGPEFVSWLWKFRESAWGATWARESSTGQTAGQTLKDLTFRSVYRISPFCKRNFSSLLTKWSRQPFTHSTKTLN